MRSGICSDCDNKYYKDISKHFNSNKHCVNYYYLYTLKEFAGLRFDDKDFKAKEKTLV